MLKYTLNSEHHVLNIKHDNDLIPVDLKKGTSKQVVTPRKSFSRIEDPLEVVNKFMLSVTDVDQKACFEILKAINTYILTYHNRDALKPYLKRQLTALLSLPSFTPAMVEKWCIENITVPVTVKKTYIKKENRTTREQTYLHDEYIELAVLTVISKIFLPVVSSFIREIKKLIGDKKKELEVLDILPTVLKRYNGYTRLFKYVEVNIADGGISLDNIVKHKLHSAMIPKWVFSLLVVKRLVSATILDVGGRIHLVTYTYNNLSSKVKVNERTAVIREKHLISGDDGDGTTTLESFRVKDHSDLVTRVVTNHALKESYIMQHTGHLFNKTAYAGLKKQLAQTDIYISPTHIAILAIVFYKLIPYGAYATADREDIKTLCLIAHMLLRDKYTLIAGLCISTIVIDSTTGIPIPPTYPVRSRLSPEQTLQLITKYPATRSPLPKDNLIIKHIDSLSKDIISHDWDNVIYNRPLDIASNIRSLLADFIMDKETLLDKR